MIERHHLVRVSLVVAARISQRRSISLTEIGSWIAEANQLQGIQSLDCQQ